MEKLFVTGVAGSGKSTISNELNKMGYHSVDIEYLEGMFKMIRKDTKEDFTDYDNGDIAKVKNGDWICDINALKKLLKKQTAVVMYYCGMPSNYEELIPLFDKVLLLKAKPSVITERLKSREGTGEFGNTSECREWILTWKDWWEEQMAARGAVILDADGSPAEVAKKIIELFQM